MKKTIPLLLSVFISLTFATEQESVYNTLSEDVMTSTVESDPAIKSFEVTVRKVEAFFSFMDGRPSYSTGMRAKIEVFDPQKLGDYAIVQYIRGCHYYTSLSDSGVVDYHLGTSREFFGKSVTFKHPEWVVDTSIKDPVYWSGSPAFNGRHYGRVGLYRLDDTFVTETREDVRLFYKHHTNETSFYITDHPSGASSSGGKYFAESNASMEFKTCLYRHSEVPSTSDIYGHAITAKPIKCFYWQNNFQYNYQTSAYEVKDEINSFCLER